MPDYNLQGLSSRSFEQLVQALAQKHLGARTVIFGDGPDGAREAEYRGRLKLPPKNEIWNGHLIIQAKFLQTVHSAPKENTEWLISQLAREMTKFAPIGSRSRKLIVPPNYYLVATNIRNSGVAKKGGKDRLSKVLNEYMSRFGWKGWMLWDEAEINRMLDNATDIRDGYAAWITSGDVLMEMLRKIKRDRPVFQKQLLAHLQQDFCSAQYAKLRQAGHGNDDKTPLSRLFVDLPITHEQSVEPPEEGEQTEVNKKKTSASLETFLKTILDRGNMRLTATAMASRVERRYYATEQGVQLQLSEESIVMKPDNIRGLGAGWQKKVRAVLRRRALVDESNRVVLLGGPGQGKTTLGQFACQVYRAALLSEFRTLPDEVQDAIDLFRAQCKNELSQIRGRRYPVWIDLKELAKWLSGRIHEPSPSFLTFLAAKLGPGVRESDVQEWLGAYPWFVVFDGLDEVPPSSGRERMLQCIQLFLSEANAADTDLLVLCTTRPQGYSQEFDERYYQHQWLAPLSPQRALAYGEKVLDVRHGTIGGDRKIYGERLRQASENETTARVMRSPLQVTIMTALVERVGKPPEQRWKLFREYYGVIYERERERGTAWSDALAKYDAEVDAIHRRVGWRLQVRSETAKNSDARLAAAEFEGEVRVELSSEGHVDEELEELVSLLGNAATVRLVFLVALGSEEVGFEIRSLQEFMAADHFFKYGDEVAARHLTRIAAITYWRNVFLFGAGRVFAERRNLREHLLGTLAHLNEDPQRPAAALTLAGSILALDILEDGSANHIPASRDSLMRLACRLFDIALPAEHERLAEVGLRCNAAILKEELERRLIGGDQEAWMAAFGCILRLWNKQEWAAKSVVIHWPKNVDDARRILLSSRNWAEESIPYPSLVGEVIQKSSPYSGMAGVLNMEELISAGLPDALLRLVPIRQEEIIFRNKLGAKIPIGLFFRSIKGLVLVPNWNEVNDVLDGYHLEWKVLWINALFMNAPSAEGLAKALERLAELRSWPVVNAMAVLAWPLEMVVFQCKSIAGLSEMAIRVRDGEFGDTELWRRMESCLVKDGIVIEKLIELVSRECDSCDQAGWGEGYVGMRKEVICRFLESQSIFYNNVKGEKSAEGIAESIECLVKALIKPLPRLAVKICKALAFVNESVDITVDTLLQVAQMAEGGRVPISEVWLEGLLITMQDSEELVGKLDSLGLMVEELWRRPWPLTERAVKSVVELVNVISRHPDKCGLWRLLSMMPFVPDFSIYAHISRIFPKAYDSQSLADGVVLRLNSRMWTKEGAEEFAGEIVQAIALRPDLIERLAEVLDHSTPGDSGVESLPAAMLDKLARDDWETRRVVRGALRRLHLRRASGLCEDDDEKEKVISCGRSEAY